MCRIFVLNLTFVQPSLSGKSHLSTSDKLHELHKKVGDSEIDRGVLHIGEKIASGSSGDLYDFLG
jgi:hypothetical protein